MNTTNYEKTRKELFLGKCWEYLDDNFHKFGQANKIKIALALAQKDLPQEVKGLSQQIVVMNEILKSEKPLRYNFGAPETADSAGHTGQTQSDNIEV